MTFKDLCDRLRKFYWSEHHPSRYVICHPTNENRMAGIGTIAHESYGAFNIAFALCAGDLHSIAGQRKIVDTFTQVRINSDLTQIVDGAELSDTLLVLDQEAFGVWYMDNRQFISANTRHWLDILYQTHDPLRHIC